MAIWYRGADVVVEADPLLAAFPGATGDVAVFVHGLVENDRSWWWSARTYYGDADVSYGTRLRDDLGITPVDLRYTTGLPVAANGRRLDELLAALVDAWPVPVERLSLVGHSMGRLVIRGACHRGAAERRPWVGLVRHARIPPGGEKTTIRNASMIRTTGTSRFTPTRSLLAPRPAPAYDRHTMP
jgi:pimeloyl-ACP methyl ester carboxylesterase